MNSPSASRLLDMLLRGVAANPIQLPSPPPSQQNQYIQLLNNYMREQQQYHQNVERMLELLEVPSVSIDFTTVMRDISGANAQPTLDLSANTTVYPYIIANGEAATCPITLEPFHEGENVRRITRCGHVFRDEALRRWTQRNHNCPVCRRNIG